jgi:hypothetical protein
MIARDPDGDQQVTGYGILGQAMWFAFGSWWGWAISARLAMLFSKILSDSGEPVTFQSMALAFVPICIFMAVCFAIWLAVRSRLSGIKNPLLARVPAILGLACPVTCAGLNVVLGRMLGFEQRLVVGGTILLACIVLPLVAGEIAFRVSRRQAARSAMQRSAVGPFSASDAGED